MKLLPKLKKDSQENNDSSLESIFKKNKLNIQNIDKIKTVGKNKKNQEKEFYETFSQNNGNNNKIDKYKKKHLAPIINNNIFIINKNEFNVKKALNKKIQTLNENQNQNSQHFLKNNNFKSMDHKHKKLSPINNIINKKAEIFNNSHSNNSSNIMNNSEYSSKENIFIKTEKKNKFYLSPHKNINNNKKIIKFNPLMKNKKEIKNEKSSLNLDENITKIKEKEKDKIKNFDTKLKLNLKIQDKNIKPNLKKSEPKKIIKANISNFTSNTSSNFNEIFSNINNISNNQKKMPFIKKAPKKQQKHYSQSPDKSFSINHDSEHNLQQKWNNQKNKKLIPLHHVSHQFQQMPNFQQEGPNIQQQEYHPKPFQYQSQQGFYPPQQMYHPQQVNYVPQYQPFPQQQFQGGNFQQNQYYPKVHKNENQGYMHHKNIYSKLNNFGNHQILNINKNKYIPDPDAKILMDKIFSFKDEIKINMLKLNLIFFYENMTKENVDLYNRLKLRVLGGYFGCMDEKIFKKLIREIEKTKSPFNVLSTGSSFEKINYICTYSRCVKNIIIYCMDTEHYRKLYASNKKIILISNEVEKLDNILNSISNEFKAYNTNLKYLINNNQIISLYEYNNYYYINHKILSYFFKEDFSRLNFCYDYMNYVFNFIDNETNYYEDEKDDLKNILRQLKNSNNFMRDSLKFYTSENKFIYLLNKTMRNNEIGTKRLSFLIGPMYYSIIRYLIKENHDLILNQDVTLYRNIIINEYDLNLYHMTNGNIICFPSFTSTSFTKGFIPTPNALNINNIKKEKINLEMVIYYEHNYNNIPHGMVLKNFSVNEHENEVLLFPFTFVKVTNLQRAGYNSYRLDCKIINKDKILEFGLKKGKSVVFKYNLMTID